MVINDLHVGQERTCIHNAPSAVIWKVASFPFPTPLTANITTLLPAAKRSELLKVFVQLLQSDMSVMFRQPNCVV